MVSVEKKFLFLIFILCSGMVLGQQAEPPGIDSVVITFSRLPLVSVQKAPLLYNKAFAMSFQMDDALSDIYQKIYPVFQGTSTSPGLTFTDGCGRSMAFKMSTSLYIFSSYNNTDILNPDDPYHNPEKLTWTQLDTLYRHHWGIENHGLFDNPDVASPEKIEYAFQRTRSYTRRKISDSVTFKSFVIPNGLDIYVNYLAKNHYYDAINQGQDNSWIGYGNIGFDVESDTINWLKPVKINRLFLYSDFKRFADSLYAESKRGKHMWLLSGMHTIPSVFLDEMKEINRSYGSPGKDNILLTTDDQILDYLIVKQSVQIHKTLRDNRLTITFSGDVPSDLIDYTLTLNVFADNPVEKIEVFGTEDYDYNGIGKDTALINLSWNGRYYYSTEMLADSFTRQAMTTGSQWKALVAMDYVMKMSSGPLKIALQDSLCSLDRTGWSIDYDAGFCNLVNLGPDTTLCPGDTLSLSGPAGMQEYNWYQNQEPFSTAPSVTVSPDTTTDYVLVVKDNAGNKMSDTIHVMVFSVPEIALGSDTSVCSGSCLSFSGPAGPYQYLWNTGDTTSSVTLCPQGDTVVKLTVKTATGCFVSDSVKVFFHLPPVIHIPQDSNSYCFGDSVLLSVITDEPRLTFLWNTGDTSSSIAFLPRIPDTTYKFFVQAKSVYGCRAADTARIFVLPEIPEFSLGADTGVCPGSCLLLKGLPGNYTYRWSTGDTTPSVTICPVSDTTVSLTLFTPEKCSASDTLRINRYSLPDVRIPEDSVASCFGDSIFLRAESNTPDVSFLWSTGDTTNTIQVMSPFPDTVMTYTVKAVSTQGCVHTDSARLFVWPAVKIKMDSTVVKACDGKPVTISCSAVQGVFENYVWSFDGNDYQTDADSLILYQPAISDWIHVKATDAHGCVAVDSAFLHTIRYPDIIIPADTGICRGDTLHITGSGGKIFYWLNGNDTLSRDSVLQVVPVKNTIYKAISGNDPLCMHAQQLPVTLFPLPETKIVKEDTAVCMDTRLTLKAIGAEHYLWYPDWVTGDTFSVTPIDTMMVYLWGTDEKGCMAKDSLLIAPAPLPETKFSGLMPSYCENDPPVVLTGFPSGGFFSGDGIRDSLFLPKQAGPGNHTITYAFVSHEGCIGKSVKKTFVYGPVPAIHLTPADTTLYPDGFVQYDAGPGFDNYYWTTGDVTREIRVNYGDFPVGTDTIRVVGVIGGCSSVGSAVVTFGAPAGIIALRVEPVMIRPNPAHRTISVTYKGNGEPFRLEIFDMTGQKVYQKYLTASYGKSTVHLNLPSLKPGLYNVWIFNFKCSYFSKMIIQ